MKQVVLVGKIKGPYKTIEETILIGSSWWKDKPDPRYAEDERDEDYDYKVEQESQDL